MPVFGNNTGDDYSGTEDCFLREDQASTTHEDDGIWAYYASGAADVWSLLKFTGLNNLGVGTVSSAILSLYQDVAGTPATFAVEFRRLLVDWNPGQATWDDRLTSTAWNTGGALGSGSDRSSTVSDSMDCPNSTSLYVHSDDLPQIRSDVEDMRDTPASNYGWHIQRSDAITDGPARRWVDDNSTDGEMPYLTAILAAAGVSANDEFYKTLLSNGGL